MTSPRLDTMLGLLAGSALALLAPTLTAQAQGLLERNLPEPVTRAAPALQLNSPSEAAGSDTPLGVDLAGVRLLGADDVPLAAPPRGVSLGALPDTEGVNIQQALQPFLGRPLSMALIVDLQGAVATLWRDTGFPFVSVTVPPQEITGGVLQLRVVEFRAGIVTVEGASAARDLGPRLRVAPGARIDARALEEDLDWLNRNPFNRAEIVFAPSDATGASDLQLHVTEAKPVTVFADYANTGNASTGLDRWSLGFGAWVPQLNDLTLSYRFTRSGDIWQGGDLVQLHDDKNAYLSHAGRIDLPLSSRQALSIAPNYVVTNQLVDGTPFAFRNTTMELPILYRSAVSNLLPGHYWGDVYAGIEPKWITRSTSFAGTDVAQGEASLTNLVLGWSNQFSDPYGSTLIDARLKANIGALDHGSDADWALFTGGRVTNAHYLTAGLDITRLTNLPLGMVWSSQLSALLASQALPDTERLGLGGFYAVRGYDGDDGAVDTGVIWRNELRLPSFPVLGAQGQVDDRLSPFAFIDIGHGYGFDSANSVTMASTGLGLDYAVADHVALNLTGAVALADAGRTRAGDWRASVSLKLSY